VLSRRTFGKISVALFASLMLRRRHALAQPSDTITLAAAGDLMLARTLGRALQRDPNDSPFAGVRDALRGADITVGNLECAIGTNGTRARKSFTFLAPPAAAASVADAGFDLVSLANNHSLDYGAEALASTMQLLAGVGVRHVGAGMNRSQAHQPAIIDVKGVRLAFLGCVNTGAEGRYRRSTWEATDDRAGVAWGVPADVKADVLAAKAQADLVIVMMHAGTEGSRTVNAVQRGLALAAIDAGAALVIGAHPHVLQPIERIGNGVVAWSLGNFVFDGFRGAANQTGILQVTLGREGVREVVLLPAVIQKGRPAIEK
jgi:poly-gamma-glutamate synthesis protein (capsule biosynthesis protein)